MLSKCGCARALTLSLSCSRRWRIGSAMSHGSPVVAWCCLLFTWDGKPPCSTDYLHTAPASTPGLFTCGTVSVYIIHSAVPVVFLNFNRVQLVSKMVENVYVVTHKPKLTFTNVYKWFDSSASGKLGHLSFLMCFSNKTTFCFCFFFLNKQNSPSLLDYKTYIYKLQIQYTQ